MSKSDTRYAWHFLRADWRTGSGNLLVKVGKTLKHDGALSPCNSGLHASFRAVDALQYAPSSLVALVGCRGEYVDNTDKFVCRERTALWGYDAEEELRLFARLCALDVLKYWQGGKAAGPDVVREYLEMGDESIRSAAESAANAAIAAAAE